MSNSVDIAKLVRQDLKALYPTIKFSVRKDGYDSVRIGYTIQNITDPQPREIDEKLGKYEAGCFNGMTDSYDYDPAKRDLPTCRYIFVNADSEAITEAYKPTFMEYYGFETFTDEEIYPRLQTWKEIGLRRFMDNVVFKGELVHA